MAQDPTHAAFHEPGKTADSAVTDVTVEVYAVLGTATMPISQVLRMGRGAVVELDTPVGGPVSLNVKGKTVFRGEVVIIENKRLYS